MQFAKATWISGSRNPTPNTLHSVAVRKDSRITQFEELRGKRVNVGPPGAGTKYSAEKLMQSYDMKDSDFAELLALKPDEQGDALCKGRIDAFIYIVGHPARNIADTASACPITLLQLTGAKVARLARTTPSYAQATIPAKSYAGQNEAVQTYGIRAVLLASSDTSDKVAYEVARAVFGNFTEFTALHPAFGGLDPATMVKTGFSAPLHPGALKYYKEKGMLK
jgi:TRAP transporter TAXI family solute receptor